jgi:hypothetical protein
MHPYHSAGGTSAPQAASGVEETWCCVFDVAFVECPILTRQAFGSAHVATCAFRHWFKHCACHIVALLFCRLLQRLSAIQGLFFQQQGDWVVQLADALEPLLTQQQQQQHMAVSSSGGGGDASWISPVVLQLLLESAVQSSCLSGVPEAERMSLQVRANGAGVW